MESIEPVKITKSVYGFYNARAYEVWLDNGRDWEQLYRGGNSPIEGQGYLRPCEGVGLNRMRGYCVMTTHDYADEQGALYGGVKYQSVAEMLGPVATAFDLGIPSEHYAYERALLW